MKRLIHRMNQTAHISLQILSISKSVETKETEMRPNFLARPAQIPLIFLVRLVSIRPRFRFRPARLTPRRCISAPPVRGVLRLVADTRNPFFREMRNFCYTLRMWFRNKVL